MLLNYNVLQYNQKIFWELLKHHNFTSIKVSSHSKLFKLQKKIHQNLLCPSFLMYHQYY